MKVSRTYKKLYYESKKRVVAARGGSSSSKTYSFLQLLFKWLRSGELRQGEYYVRGVATVARKYRVEHTASTLRDFKGIVRDEGFYFSNKVSGGLFIKENRSEMTYEYDGRIIEFKGADEILGAKGPRRKILYINEADKVEKEIAFQLMLRTEGAIFMDWNPDDDEARPKIEIEEKRTVEKGDVDNFVFTFRDNAFLSSSIVEELLYLRTNAPELWRIYGNGEYGKISGVIFQEGVHWEVIERLPTTAIFRGNGLDFGFSPDPSVLVGIYEYGRKGIIIDERLWRENLHNIYKDENQKQESLTGQFELIGVERHEEIWADSSEPKSIEEIASDGYNINAVKKGPGSVYGNIKFMWGYKLYITARSLNVRRNFKKYIWATDKNGKTLRDTENRPIPLNKNKHGPDAAAYGISSLFAPSEAPVTGLKLKVG